MRKIAFLALIIALAVFSACRKHPPRFEDDYPMMRGVEHVYVKAGYEEVIEALTTAPGGHVIFFAFDTRQYECPYCLACVPLLNEVARELGIEKILYFDVYAMRKERTAEYVLLLGYLDGQVGDLLERNGRKEIVVPDVYVVKDGEILGHHIATIKDDDDRFVYDLNAEQKEAVKEIYRDLLGRL